MATSKKTAAKKAAKKTSKKAAAKKATAKKAVTKKTAAKKSGSKKTTAAAETKPAASTLLKSRKHDTPAVFKVPQRKGANVVFSLEDVRKILKERAEAGPVAAKPTPATKKSATKKAAAKKVAPAPEVIEEEAPVAKKREAASLADILGFGGPSASPAPVATPKREVPAKWRKYYELLLELRTDVRDGLTSLSEDTLKKSQKEDTGDLSTSVDSGSDNFDRDFALSLLSTEQEALREIEAAIDRIYDGTYGVCEITGEPIAPERLEAVPFTRYSLAGQQEHERNPRRRRQQSGAFFAEGSGDAPASFGDDDDN